MNDISLKHVYKVYPSRDKGPSLFKRLFKKTKEEAPKDFVAVKDFNLEIKNGEFVVKNDCGLRRYQCWRIIYGRRFT